jgi:hypothetical protein
MTPPKSRRSVLDRERADLREGVAKLAAYMEQQAESKT